VPHSANRWKKRGLAITCNKYGLAFGLTMLNQGGALVHIYLDGSVLVSIGGIEMGQGLFTKCYQVGMASKMCFHNGSGSQWRSHLDALWYIL